MQEASEYMRDQIGSLMNSLHSETSMFKPRVQIEMPRYISHKTVWALKISAVHNVVAGHNAGGGVLGFSDTRYADRQVSPEYMAKHLPKPGGYFVVYSDGYESFSPAEAFEKGYSPVGDLEPIAKESLDGIETEANAVLIGIPSSTNHNGLLLMDPSFVRIMVKHLRRIGGDE